MERNTAVLVLVLVMAAGLALFALQSSSNLHREMGGVREQEQKLAAPPPARPAPAEEPPKAPPAPPTAAEPPAPVDAPPAPDRPPTLDDVARELVLSPERRDRLESLSNGLKREIFDLLSVPRADGGSLADDVLKARAAGDAEAEKALLARAAVDRIPGTSMSYVDGRHAARRRAFSRLVEEMSKAELSRFVRLKADLEYLDTGFDPWKDALPK